MSAPDPVDLKQAPNLINSLVGGGPVYAFAATMVFFVYVLWQTGDKRLDMDLEETKITVATYERTVDRLLREIRACRIGPHNATVVERGPPGLAEKRDLLNNAFMKFTERPPQ